MSTLDLAVYETELHLARRQRTAKSGGVIGVGSPHTDAVKAVQNRLTELGYAVNADGIFGSDTQRAVRDFQKSRNAKVDGLVGQETLGKLLRSHKAAANPADPSLDAVQQVVAPGMPQPSTSGRGLGNIRAVQRGGGSAPGQGGATQTSRSRATTGRSGQSAQRVRAGAGTTSVDPATGAPVATSSTGPIGSTKVKTPTNTTFEQAHPRGAAGTPEGGKFAAKGSSGAEVQNTQTALNHSDHAGHSQLKIDGQFGDKTEARVKQFQRNAGIKVDGVVGPETSGALRKRVNYLAKQHKTVSTPT